ncbi:PTS sugar transporter subunit IIA [Superficieibacter electus]|uniref:PTS sugar transporter subunit IIA n=1 Tax=Superficieibacter electus TaxID=2022662 RepID=A0A2P5GUS4_9ENTR|nr:sigma 54-interacting transcriptional regulator [Superficieibacter electus]POP44292.1 PTS sugar transporter subunit IIA [Superficieibacter electus]POP50310.1 PTS sugar transporter subunit IIA [Superficieibacter electus]
MSAKEDLYHKLNATWRTPLCSFTTQDCENFTSASRSVISLYLNQLCEDGYLRKEATRPVRFWLTEHCLEQDRSNTATAFNALIGSMGSLKTAVELCVAAVNYPEGGLPVLLTGESGVGKSYLAQLLHQYACETGAVATGARLVELNCADYANNPELLSGTLFGYVKGAFTGADRHKTGLLDDADGGFLFLDEVHRLSAENQEKLFLFMDKGYFYRLGDNSQPCKARVRFVFATTENTGNVLLTTFRRRIPVNIQLPSWESRPFMEQLTLISSFFSHETRRFRQDIHVDNALIRQLIATPVQGNIGELKNHIKVLCASAWARRNQTGICIDGPTGRHNEKDRVTFSALDNAPDMSSLSSFYSGPDENLLENFCRSANVPLFIRKLEEQAGRLPANRFYQGTLWQLTKDSLVEFNDLTGITVGPVMEKAVFHCLQWSLNEPVEEERVKYLNEVTGYAPLRARLLAQECVTLFEKHFTPAQICLMEPLLSAIFSHQVEPEPLIQGIIVSHGSSTASSIAGTANKLLGGFYLKAFDMPLSVNTKGIISRLKEWIIRLKEQNGMIILVDMGSLQDIYSEIKLHIQGDLLVMNNVSTAMALDIAGKIQHKLAMKEIVDNIKGAWEVEARYYSGIVEGNKIIISCISGEGVARQLQEITRRYISDESIDIVTMEYDDLKWKISKADSALYGTRLLITTTEIDAGYLPQINTRQLIGEKPELLWKNYFSQIMPIQEMQRMIDEIVILFTLEGVAGHLSFLNPRIIIDEVENVVKFFELTYGIHFESYLRINLFMHLAAMIERLLTHDGLSHRDEFELTPHQHAYMALVPEAFRTLITKYRITLTTTEALMIYELMEPWITVASEDTLVLKNHHNSV